MKRICYTECAGRIKDSNTLVEDQGGSEMTHSRLTASGTIVLIGDIERAIVAECETEEEESGVDYRTVSAQIGFSGFSVAVHV